MTKKITILTFFIFLTGCGYSPLLNTEKINFYIADLNFSGDKKISNYILNNLKKYQKPNENTKNYNINITSIYEKTIASKDRSGNPTNYNIRIKANITAISHEGSEINKSFERNRSLTVQVKKIDENELEKKYKESLSNLLSEDIVFFLSNQ
tara:strand:- start:318 stop:773 length:456 start_codon:yes stop_codon:yes gene_type:complete